jgi:uncharacterized protein (TIGR03083 family)
MEPESSSRAIIDQLDGVLDALESLDARDWNRPTRCPGWDVRQLASHVAVSPRALARGLEALRQGREVSVSVEPLAADLPAAHVLTALRERRRDAAAALAGLTPGQLQATLPMAKGAGFGLPTATMLQLALVEIGIHRSDLDAALGRDDRLDAQLLAAVVEVVPTWLIFAAATAPRPASSLTYHLAGDQVAIAFAYDSSGTWGLTDMALFADCAVRGQDPDLALFMLGRRSVDDNSIQSSDRDLLRRFKTYLPGP